MKIVVYNNPDSLIASFVYFTSGHNNINAENAKRFVPEHVEFWIIERSEVSDVQDRDSFNYSTHRSPDGIGTMK
ncbi:hypothetical protein Q8E21_001914 [Vibrio vulnificus]|nr:hypothetical protein [Vibrio vulnificus]